MTTVLPALSKAASCGGPDAGDSITERETPHGYGGATSLCASASDPIMTHGKITQRYPDRVTDKSRNILNLLRNRPVHNVLYVTLYYWLAISRQNLLDFPVH